MPTVTGSRPGTASAAGDDPEVVVAALLMPSIGAPRMPSATGSRTAYRLTCETPGASLR